MSFTEVMLRVLPPVNGQQPHITGHYGEQRANGPHGGTDFNYIGGQSGLNLQYPKVYAPIAGVVSFTGGSYGTIKIKDAEGNSHEILHTSSHVVSVGATVAAGDEIGAMGGQGPNGAAQYPRHVHYQMKGPTGTLISPEIWWDGQSGATNSSPSVASKQTASSDFQFPIRKADGGQFSDIDEIYKALEAETSGHYLLGGHNFWHGGIHISDKSAPQCVRDEPIRCIGDGVVVAYRLNKQYLVSEYVGADACTALNYSTSFCLVRHEYQSPINKESKGDISNKLIFFSLYMHLLPYELYEKDSDERARRFKVVNGGWPARDFHMDDSKSRVVGSIPAGIEFEILQEQATADGKYVFAQGKISKGSFSGFKEKDIVWFAIQEQGAPIKNNMGKERLTELVPAARSTPSYWKGIVEASVSVLQGLKVRGAPDGDKGGAQVSPGQVLCTGSVIRFDSGKIRWLLLEDRKKYPMAECTLVPSESSGLKGAGTLPEKFWCCVDDVGPKAVVARKGIVPVDFESVVITNTAIRAGEPIGYMGLYEVPVNERGGIQSKHQVHVEIFSSDTGLESFLKNPAGLMEGRRFLVLKPEQMLAVKSGTDKTPIFTEQGPVLKTKSYSVMDAAATIKDANGDEWLKVSILDSETTQKGYVNKKNVEVICKHDWEKLGYTVLKESNDDADGFLDPKDMPAFFQEVYSKIDAMGTKDGVVTPAELQAALGNSNIRNIWSKFIAYHPTEWQAKSSAPKWNRLKDLLKDSPALLKHEQERIDKLIFWDELAGAVQIALPKNVYHFNPLAFINNIQSKLNAPHTGLFTVADGEAAIKIIYKKYGKEMAVIIERMYRDETGHFKSGQYENCGTGGMEAFGSPPYYGWDGAIFEAHPEYAPVGTWSSFENKGMSDQGGNKQVKDKKKVFVVLPSVIAGMEYKAAYIKKWDGNWARWHSKEPSAQNAYKTHIQAIRARFVEALEKDI